MKLTERDIRLLRDIALSRIMSRDQIIRLGYFGSVTRVNTRVRELARVKYLCICATPFFRQHLYCLGSSARDVIGERIVNAIASSGTSPRFVQHALAVNDVRIAFAMRGSKEWRFDAQLRHAFLHAGRRFEIRPDGLIRNESMPAVLEVDLGHVSLKKFAEKLKAYEAFLDSGEARRLWLLDRLEVCTITTGELRKAHLARLARPHPQIAYDFRRFSDFDVEVYGGWS